MLQLTEITSDEIIEMLAQKGIFCDELGFTGNKWSYAGGYVEGESKWALRLCVDADTRYAALESLEAWSHSKNDRVYIAPHAAIEYLACSGLLKKGEYLIWAAW